MKWSPALPVLDCAARDLLTLDLHQASKDAAFRLNPTEIWVLVPSRCGTRNQGRLSFLYGGGESDGTFRRELNRLWQISWIQYNRAEPFYSLALWDKHMAQIKCVASGHAVKVQSVCLGLWWGRRPPSNGSMEVEQALCRPPPPGLCWTHVSPLTMWSVCAAGRHKILL